MVRFPTVTTMARTLFAGLLAGLGLLTSPFGTAFFVFDAPKPIPGGQPKLMRKPGKVFWSVKCQLQDKAGNLWFSTGGEGVYRFDGTSFTNFTTKDGLLDNDVSAIIEDKSGNLVFGTKGGVCKYDGKDFSKYSANTDLHRMPVTCSPGGQRG